MDETGAYYTSEVSQKEKHQYSIRYTVTITLYARQQKKHRCIKQSFGLCGEGKGGMIWENSIETCILSHVKWIISPGLMHETGCSGLVKYYSRCFCEGVLDEINI